VQAVRLSLESIHRGGWRRDRTGKHHPEHRNGLVRGTPPGS